MNYVILIIDNIALNLHHQMNYYNHEKNIYNQW